MASQPDVIHTWTTPAASALAAATSTIPIVAAPIGEWTLSELVGDMVRPTGNITGLTLDNRDQQEKCLQILKEAAPHITRVGVLRNPLIGLVATGRGVSGQRRPRAPGKLATARDPPDSAGSRGQMC